MCRRPSLAIWRLKVFPDSHAIFPSYNSFADSIRPGLIPVSSICHALQLGMESNVSSKSTDAEWVSYKIPRRFSNQLSQHKGIFHTWASSFEYTLFLTRFWGREKCCPSEPLYLGAHGTPFHSIGNLLRCNKWPTTNFGTSYWWCEEVIYNKNCFCQRKLVPQL